MGFFSCTRLLCPAAISLPSLTNADPIGIPPSDRLFFAWSMAACMNWSMGYLLSLRMVNLPDFFCDCKF